MPTIVISDASTSLAVDSTHFTLRAKGRRIGRIPPTMIERLIIHDGVEVSRKALDRLGNLGVPVTFLGKEGRVEARLMPSWRLDAAPRLEQARIWHDPALRLRLARRFVDAKIANAAAVLRRHSGNHPSPELNDAISEMNRLRPRSASATAIDELMGIEGMAGRIYFGVFARMLRASWASFGGRNRRPPLDPVNAVLSYCYAVLHNELHSLVEAAGLDPAIGFLHSASTKRPNLALDLLEPFRAVLGDRLSLRMINLGTLKEEHFQSRLPQPGIWINYDGRMVILKEVDSWSRECDEALGEGWISPGGLLTREVDRFAKHASEGRLAEFVPHYQNPGDASAAPSD
jgi:CRISPR-associated protein Cas1